MLPLWCPSLKPWGLMRWPHQHPLSVAPRHVAISSSLRCLGLPGLVPYSQDLLAEVKLNEAGKLTPLRREACCSWTLYGKPWNADSSSSLPITLSLLKCPNQPIDFSSQPSVGPMNQRERGDRGVLWVSAPWPLLPQMVPETSAHGLKPLVSGVGGPWMGHLDGGRRQGQWVPPGDGIQ